MGDILAIITYSHTPFIKSTVKSNKKSFTYTLYYASEVQHHNSELAVIYSTGCTLKKATFTVDKSTGYTDLKLREPNAYNPYRPNMNEEILKEFSY